MRSLRPVELPSDIRGRLFLHSMPGRYEPLEEFWTHLGRVGCSTIVCLAPIDEMRKKSPSYADALDAESSPCKVLHFPIPDYKAPEDIAAFVKSVNDVAEALRQGDAILVHCGAGIGRTGTFAIGTLIALGLSLEEARTRVSKAGSSPERPEQEESLRRLASGWQPRRRAPGSNEL